MKRWLWIIGTLSLATFLVLAFDYWRREPYRQRERFDAVEIGMTKEQVIAIMGTGKRVVFIDPPPPCGEMPSLICCYPGGVRPRLRREPYKYSFHLDANCVLVRKSVRQIE